MAGSDIEVAIIAVSWSTVRPVSRPRNLEHYYFSCGANSFERNFVDSYPAWYRAPALLEGFGSTLAVQKRSTYGTRVEEAPTR